MVNWYPELSHEDAIDNDYLKSSRNDDLKPSELMRNPFRKSGRQHRLLFWRTAMGGPITRQKLRLSHETKGEDEAGQP